MLIRVKKQDVQRDAFEKPDSLTTCLTYWATWMGKADIDIGMQIGSDDFVGTSNPYQRRETQIAEAVDAMISGLKPCYKWAIFRRCGIARVWNFPNLDFEETLQQAEENLIEKLKNNVATRSMF